MRYQIEIPRTQETFSAMWRLNHKTFSDELGQHAPREDGMLIDKFHAKNIYRVARIGSRVVGMIAAHAQAPFSVVSHFGKIMEDEIIPGKTGEIRLLALEKDLRGRSRLAVRLCDAILDALACSGIEKIVVTGIESQRKFYENIGLRVVGESIRDGNAVFYPMCASVEAIRERHRKIIARICHGNG